MKRSDLVVGLIVEDKWGHELVVVDTEPWADTGYMKRNIRRTVGGNGVAVMYSDNNFHNEQIWRPAVKQLGQLYPKGTYAEKRAREAAAHQLEHKRLQEKRSREELLRKRLGIEYQHDLHIGGTRVTLPLEKLEELMRKAGV